MTGAGNGAPPVLMYANGWCPYCAAARALLADKGARVEEIDIDAEPGRRDEMMARSGRHTVPQVFVGDRHIGGYDDLAALERAGELDSLLRGTG